MGPNLSQPDILVDLKGNATENHAGQLPDHATASVYIPEASPIGVALMLGGLERTDPTLEGANILDPNTGKFREVPSAGLLLAQDLIFCHLNYPRVPLQDRRTLIHEMFVIEQRTIEELSGRFPGLGFLGIYRSMGGLIELENTLLNGDIDPVDEILLNPAIAMKRHIKFALGSGIGPIFLAYEIWKRTGQIIDWDHFRAISQRAKIAASGLSREAMQVESTFPNMKATISHLDTMIDTRRTEEILRRFGIDIRTLKQLGIEGLAGKDYHDPMAQLDTIRNNW